MTLPSSTPAVKGPSQSMGLLRCYHEFHAEVVRLKKAVSGKELLEPDEERPNPEAVQSQLRAELDRQSTDARGRLNEREQRDFEAAQYVMVAMADEVFLLLKEWKVGHKFWTRRPLEAEAPFSSHIAGEEIFKRLDKIIQGQASVSVELLSVYLAALALGFEGKFRGSSAGAGEPERYRQELVRKLEKADSAAVKPASELLELCPEVYNTTLVGSPRRGLPTLQVALVVVVIVFLCWLSIGRALWQYQTLEVDEQITRIEDANKQIEEDVAAARKAAAAAREAGADAGKAGETR